MTNRLLIDVFFFLYFGTVISTIIISFIFARIKYWKGDKSDWTKTPIDNSMIASIWPFLLVAFIFYYLFVFPIDKLLKNIFRPKQ